MEEAAILGWRYSPGESVTAGDALFEIETDKVVVEVPVPCSGTLLRIDVESGTAAVNQAVAYIGEPGEELPVPIRRTRMESAVPVSQVETSRGERVTATPLARKLARELSLDLDRIAGTGPGGRITEQDVSQAGIRREI